MLLLTFCSLFLALEYTTSILKFNLFICISKPGMLISAVIANLNNCITMV